MHLAELSVLWSVAIVAMIVSVNSRGPLRVGLSWFLTAIILVLTVFVSSMKLANLKDQMMEGPASEVQRPLRSNPSHTAPPAEESVSNEPVSKSQVQSPESLKDYVTTAERLVGSALGCSGAIASFDISGLNSLSDTQYEQEQSRALSLRNQSSTISRQIKSLRPPQSAAWIQSDLDKAGENLRLAGWAVHAYFSAENSDDEAERQAQFEKNARAAQVAFKTIQQELLRLR